MLQIVKNIQPLQRLIITRHTLLQAELKTQHTPLNFGDGGKRRGCLPLLEDDHLQDQYQVNIIGYIKRHKLADSSIPLYCEKDKLQANKIVSSPIMR